MAAFTGLRRFADTSILIYSLRTASLRSWKLTLNWFGFNVLGGLMPLWGTYVLWILHSQKFAPIDFLSHGEFALYSAAFLAPALQQVLRNIKDTKYVLGPGTVLLAVAALVVSVLIYSGVQPPQTVDQRILVRWSLILLPVSVLFSVMVTLIENQMAEPDIAIAERRELERLSDQIDAKQPQSSAAYAVADSDTDDIHASSEQDLERAFGRQPASSNPGGDADAK